MSPLKVYVAGAYAEAPRVERAFDWVRSRDELALAHDWLSVIRAVNKPDGDLSRADARKYANADLEQLRAADLVWFLLPQAHVGRGCWVEFGYALGLSPSPAIVTSGPQLPTVFAALADQHCALDIVAERYILMIASRVRAAAAEGVVGA